MILKIGNREFTVEPTTVEHGDRKEVIYTLTGKRGAKYSTLRNYNNPHLMSIITMRGFGLASGLERVWLTDEHGILEIAK